MPMKIFPAVHYSMGGLWADYERTADGGLDVTSPRNNQTNIPGLFAIGECNYQYHGANRLGANSLLSCIFDGLITGQGVATLLKSHDSCAAEMPSSLFSGAEAMHREKHEELLNRPVGGENPYLIHQQLGDIMTRAATVVRRNDQLQQALDQVTELGGRAQQCSLSDTGNWTNQNVVFTKALMDMFPLAQLVLQGALRRDECRGAHFKPEFAMPSLTGTTHDERLVQAEKWCDRFDENNQRWLKSTIGEFKDGSVQLSYEEVDTSLIPPRPRLYGLVGAEVIEEVWKRRAEAGKAATGQAAATA
jgi:succinate dehydrogenase / fumarate reductase flavoprotein subunit